jgi:hypothetical protein
LWPVAAAPRAGQARVGPVGRAAACGRRMGVFGSFEKEQDFFLKKEAKTLLLFCVFYLVI